MWVREKRGPLGPLKSPHPCEGVWTPHSLLPGLGAEPEAWGVHPLPSCPCPPAGGGATPTLGGAKRGRLCVPPHPSWKLEGTDSVPWGRSQGRCSVTAPHQEAPSALPPPETFPPDEITPASGEQAPIVKGWGPERKGVFQALKNSSPEIYESAWTGIVPSSAQHQHRLCHTHPRP